MGQCSSQPILHAVHNAVHVDTAAIRKTSSRQKRKSQPSPILRESAKTTCSTSQEDASYTITTMADSYATFDRSLGIRRDAPSRQGSSDTQTEATYEKGYQSESEGESEESESDSEGSESNSEGSQSDSEDSEEEEGSPSTLPSNLLPYKTTAFAPTAAEPEAKPEEPTSTTEEPIAKTAEEWCENYLNNFEPNKSGHSSSQHTSEHSKTSRGWNEPYEASMTSIGIEDEEEDEYNWEDEAPSHFHLSMSSDIDLYPTTSALSLSNHHGQQISSNDDSLTQILPPPNHPLAKRRCSKSSDPMSSWSDLTTSLHPNSNCVVPRRGSLTSWGGLNLSASTGASLNPYGFSNHTGHRRGSVHSGRSRSRSPISRHTGRRYSMTPSFATVSEKAAESLSEFDDWMDSDLSSVVYMEPKELSSSPSR